MGKENRQWRLQNHPDQRDLSTADLTRSVVERDLRGQALQALQIQDPHAKCAEVLAICLSTLPIDANRKFDEPPQLPGRADKPELVHPTKVKQRSVQSVAGRAALIHSLAHIELNAVNLALDIVWRFPGLPDSFYRQWMGVAQDEAKHFGLLCTHLRTLGQVYGDFTAHNGLWDMAEKTKADLLARLALVPRTLEARGLDMSPVIRDKLLQVGDAGGAAILDIILRDEIGHVAIGNQWYRWVCAQQGRDPIQTYADMAAHYKAPALRGPFNLEARRAAGFEQAELDALGNI